MTARSKPLTESDIWDACDQIRAAGENPTCDRLTDHLERGSRGTIAKYLKTWKENPAVATEPKLESVTRHVGALSELIRAELKEEFAEELATAQSRSLTAEDALERQSDRLLKSQERVNALETTVRERDATIHQMTTEAAVTKRALERAQESAQDNQQKYEKSQIVVNRQLEANAQLQQHYDQLIKQIEALQVQSKQQNENHQDLIMRLSGIGDRVDDSVTKGITRVGSTVASANQLLADRFIENAADIARTQDNRSKIVLDAVQVLLDQGLTAHQLSDALDTVSAAAIAYVDQSIETTARSIEGKIPEAIDLADVENQLATLALIVSNMKEKIDGPRTDLPPGEN